MWPILLLADWRVFVAVLAIVGMIGAVAERRALSRARRFFLDHRESAIDIGAGRLKVPGRWRDHAVFGSVPRDIVVGAREGVLRGRPFAVFLLRYDIPRWRMRGFAIDVTGLVGMALFTAVVVEGELPSAVRATSQRKRLAPWHSAFGRESSIAWRSGFATSAEIDERLSALVGAIDELAVLPASA